MHAERRAAAGQLIVVAGTLALIAAAAVAGPAALRVAPMAALIAVLALTYRSALRWPSLLAGLALIVLLVPIRRYRMPIELPFQLEPYRIYVLLAIGAWAAALLTDRRVRLRASGLEGPIALLLVGILVSIVGNLGRISEQALAADVTKHVTFLTSFFLVFYLVVSVVRSMRDADSLLGVLVGGGVVLSVLGVIETKTGFNPFDHLDRVIPILTPDDDLSDAVFRAGLTRAYGSAQHPIAFGAMLAMLLPPALYFAYRRRSKLAWLSALVILIGSLTTVSRTSVVMLAVIGIVITLLRPRAVWKNLPLILPALVAVQLALPGTLVTIKAMFLPEGGLVAEQANAPVGSGRVSSLGPALDEFAQEPLMGVGYGTRIVSGPERNSFILDDQWLGLLLETGVLGVAGWAWFFWRFGRLGARTAREDDGDRGWLLVALTASVTAFAAGMFFYDALSFIQATIVMFLLVGIGAAVSRNGPDTADSVAAPEGAR